MVVFLVSPYREWGGDRLHPQLELLTLKSYESYLEQYCHDRQVDQKKQKENRTEGLVGKMLGSLLTTHEPKANAEESHVTEIECGLK